MGAALVVAVAASAAFVSQQTVRRAGAARTDPSELVWLGPTGTVLEDAIDMRLKSALVALDNPNGESSDRIRAYRSEMQTVRSLLRRALLANLADTRAIQRLAAVDWELSVLDGHPNDSGVATLINVAAARAPRVPEIQVELGELLYKLGRSNDATRFMGAAVSLSAAMSHRVVAIMTGAGIDPADVLAALPPAPEVLTALAPSFSAQHRDEEFLAILEARMRVDPSRILETYGNLALSLGQTERVRSQLAGVGQLEDTRSEAERQHQLGRAAALDGETDTAYRFGMRSLSLRPTEPRYCEFAAYSAMESNHLAEAESLLREGLSRLAVMDDTSGWRARFYRGLGEIREREGKGDDALVLYRRALEQDPSESIARAKIAQIESLLGPKDGQRP